MGDSKLGEQFFYQALGLAKKIGKPGSHYFISSVLAFVGFLHGDLDHVKRYLPAEENMVIGKVTPISIGFYLGKKALLAAVIGKL